MRIAAWGKNDVGQVGCGYSSKDVLSPMGTILPDNVKQIGGGGDTAFYLLSNGRVVAVGGNDEGQLGTGSRLPSALPVTVPVSRIKEVAAWGPSAMFLDDEGVVWTIGANDCGQLGVGTVSPLSQGSEIICGPLILEAGVVQIAAGGATRGVILSDGTVNMWGENTFGQVGDGTTETKTTPTLIPGLTDVVKLSIGGEATLHTHVLVLRADGSVWGWGSAWNGELGGTIPAHGHIPNVLTPQPIAALEGAGVVDVFAGGEQSYVLTAGGLLLGFGNNEEGALGLSGEGLVTTPRPVLADVSTVSAAWRNALAIVKGQVYAWGRNPTGMLGLGTEGNVVTTPTLVPGLSGVKDIHIGFEYACALLTRALPAPPVKVTDEHEGLTVSWPVSESPTHIEWRPTGKPGDEWSPQVTVPAGTSSYTVTGLPSGQPTQIRLSSSGEAVTAEGIPS